MKTVRAWCVIRDDGDFQIDDIRNEKKLAEGLAKMLNKNLYPKTHTYKAVPVEIREVEDE